MRKLYAVPAQKISAGYVLIRANTQQEALRRLEDAPVKNIEHSFVENGIIDITQDISNNSQVKEYAKIHRHR